MIDIRFKPLAEWPGKLGQRGDSFRATYPRTLDLLEYELDKLRATQIIIEAGFRLNQIANSGWPLAKQEPAHPGVVLYFKGSGGAMRFPAGTYARWQANVHALALTLESLRAVDRYGVTHGQEQYRGFTAIAAPGAAQTMTAQAAAELVVKISGMPSVNAILMDKLAAEAGIRTAQVRTHPDRVGTRENWDTLAVAIEVLKAHHKERMEADLASKPGLNV